MKNRAVLFILLITLVSAVYAQTQSRRLADTQPARQYAEWARQMIDEGRFEEALAGLERAMDFADVSSDISYLFAIMRIKNLDSDEARFYSRLDIIETLDRAIETNRWEFYNEGMALLIKAEQLIVIRRYEYALSVLDQIEISLYPSSVTDNNPAADLAFLRLLAYRGLANSGSYDSIQALTRFRSLVLQSMDRYPRDPRPLRVFFEYARNRNPGGAADAAFELTESDISLLELALRRLPFLLETDPDLAWMASPFMRDTDAAKRYVAAYRAGGLSQSENFKPVHSSIAAALSLGLIGDIEAVEELFDTFEENEKQVLDKNTITGIYNWLLSEEGRDLFTRRILSFSGEIVSDDDGDGNIESRAFYDSGFLSEYRHDKNQIGTADLIIFFDADRTPRMALLSDAGQPFTNAVLYWERYPSVLEYSLNNEVFSFRPADFQYAPVTFDGIGGSQRYTGLFFPVPSRYEIARRTLVYFCASLSRPSPEFDGAAETIYFERGIPVRSVETFNGKQISASEYERGSPVIQYVDMDMDGRMETIRRFYPATADFAESFDIRKLLAFSESDWTGDGRHKTGEVYRPDGSVVYTWDMDGSGVMNYYYENENGNK